MSSTNIAGIFFDLGGTLYSYRNVAKTNIPILIEAAARLQRDVDEERIKAAYAQASHEVSHTYADRDYYLHRDMFSDIFHRFIDLIDGTHNEELTDWYHITQQNALVNCLEIKADCIDTLVHLKERGLYLSIVSNIDNAMLEPLVEREALHQYFDHWTSSETARSCKPHAGFFKYSLQRSGLDAQEVLFVGDSLDHDIVGAHAAGMRTALITDGGMTPPLQTGRAAVEPHHTIESLSELKTLF